MKLEVGKKYKGSDGRVFEVIEVEDLYTLSVEGCKIRGKIRAFQSEVQDFKPFVEPKFKKGDLIRFSDFPIITQGLRRIEEVLPDGYTISIWCESAGRFIGHCNFPIDWTHERAVTV
jgi:hypothetical protein